MFLFEYFVFWVCVFGICWLGVGFVVVIVVVMFGFGVIGCFIFYISLELVWFVCVVVVVMIVGVIWLCILLFGVEGDYGYDYGIVGDVCSVVFSDFGDFVVEGVDVLLWVVCLFFVGVGVVVGGVIVMGVVVVVLVFLFVLFFVEFVMLWVGE